MKQTLNIYSNQDLKFFFEDIFKSYNLLFKKINDLEKESEKNKIGLVLVSDKKFLLNKKIKNKNNKIFLCNFWLDKIQSEKKLFFQAPVKMQSLINIVSKLLLSQQIIFGDIEIIDDKIINLKTKEAVFLTSAEKQILTLLINLEKCKRSFIKEKILNIKKTLETNSLDSHLSRIRKKLNKIKSKVNVSSKNDFVLISSY